MASLVNIFEDVDDQDNDIIVNLKKFIRKEISARELIYSDDFITDVKIKYPLGQSIIVLDKTDTDFLESVDVSESDIWLYNRVMGGGYSCDGFEDYSYILDDFLNSGARNFTLYLDDDNIELLKRISNYIAPGREFNLQDSSFMHFFANLLYSLFENEIEYILNDLTYYINDTYCDSIKEGLTIDFEDGLDHMGFLLRNGDIAVKIADLVMHIRYFDYHGDIKGLYEKIVQKYGNKIRGGWSENYYEYYDDKYFNVRGFNHDTSRYLDRIIDEIEDDDTFRFKDYIGLVQRISSQFKFGDWYQLPKNRKYSFQIVDIDKDTFLFSINISGPKGFFKRKLDEEAFYNFLYTGELFDLET